VQTMIHYTVSSDYMSENPEIPPGVLELPNTEDIIVELNVFKNNSSTGITASTPAWEPRISFKNNIIRGNVFINNGAGAIMLGEYFVEPANYCEGNEISNNYIENTGADFWGASGICIGWAKNNRVVNNEFRNLPYSGIASGWGWEHDEEVKEIRDNIFTHNYFYNIMHTMSDGAAVYFNSVQSGTVISRNYINTVTRGAYALSNWKCVVAIYLDLGVGGAAIEHNAHENINTETVDLFYDKTPSSKNHIPNNISHIWATGETSPNSTEIKTEAGLTPEYRYIIPGYTKP